MDIVNAKANKQTRVYKTKIPQNLDFSGKPYGSSLSKDLLQERRDV